MQGEILKRQFKGKEWPVLALKRLDINDVQRA